MVTAPESNPYKSIRYNYFVQICPLQHSPAFDTRHTKNMANLEPGSP